MLKRRTKKYLRRSAKCEAILKYIEKTGLVTLETLVNLLLASGAIAGAMMASKSQAISNLHNLGNTFEGVDFTSEKSFYRLAASLEKEGLISNENGIVSTAKKGLLYLAARLRLPTRAKKYKPVNKKSRTLNLIIFDIPEKQRAKRDWLRDALKQIGYRQLQQSVWWGNCSVPFDFLSDINKYDLLDYVHILKIAKQGSVSRLLLEK